MLRKRPQEPFARRWWIDQSIEKDSPIPVGQNERFMRRNRPPNGIRERGHAEIRQFAPFELRRTFDQSLRRFIDVKAKPFFPKPSVHLADTSLGGRKQKRRASVPAAGKEIVEEIGQVFDSLGFTE